MGDTTKVLVIDDDATSLTIVTAMLANHVPACEVVSASSGRQGLKIAREVSPDTILLDIVMPGMDGFEVCRILKDDPTTRHIPVIFLTGESYDSASRIRALEAGGDAFLTKPVLADELIAQVRAMLRIKRAEDVLRGEKYALERLVAERTAMLEEHEAKYQTLFDNAGDAIFIHDAEARILAVNQLACERLGYTRAELTSMTVGQIDSPEHAHHAPDRINRLMDAGRLTFETVHQARDGSFIPTEVSARHIVWDGQPAMMSICRDITERKRAQEEAERTAREWQTTFDATNDAIWILDAEHRIKRSNKTAEQFAGRPVREILGEHCWKIVHGTDEPHPECPFGRARKSGRRETMQLEAGERWLDVVVDPIVDAAGRLTGAVHIVSDITERKRAEQQLRANQIQLSNALKMARAGHWEYDVVRDTFTFNDNFFEVFRTTAAAVGGYQMSAADYARRFCHPDDAVLVGKETQAAIDATDPDFSREIEHRILFADGETGHIAVRFGIVKDSEGRTVKTLGVNQDISQRKREEEALKRSETRLRSVLDAAPFPVALVDVAVNNIDYWSRSAKDLFGHTAPTAAQWYEMVYPDPDYRREVADRWKPMVDKARSSGRTVNAGEYRVTCNDGSERICELYATFLDADFVVTFNDITERKRAEAALESSRTQLLQAQKMEAIGRLAGGVAHDFNNLMQAVLLQTQALQLDASSPELTESVAGIKAHIELGKSLTRQLLLFSSAQVAERKLLDLGAVTTTCVAMLRRLLPENTPLMVETTPNPLWVEANDGQIEQIVINLALNARDAMPNGGALTIRTDGSDSEVYVEVADTGDGIDQATLPHIFEPFFTTKQLGHGTGLGLAVVHGVVEQYGGRIEVSSRLGAGSRFRVVFPAAAGQPAAGVADANDAALRRGRGERLLVVEDEDGARLAMAKVLTRLGYQVTAVGSGEEALILEQAPPFDLLLTDLMLPGIAGSEVAEKLGERWPGLVTVLMSGYAENQKIREQVELHAVRFLAKPFDMFVLAREVRQALDAAGSSAESDEEGS